MIGLSLKVQVQHNHPHHWMTWLSLLMAEVMTTPCNGEMYLPHCLCACQARIPVAGPCRSLIVSMLCANMPVQTQHVLYIKM